VLRDDSDFLQRSTNIVEYVTITVERFSQILPRKPQTHRLPTMMSKC